MKRTVVALLTISLLLVGCRTSKPMLKGTYQSDMVNDVVVQMSFAPDENNSFTQYISNREVDKGTCEKKENNIYQIKSDKQNFEIKLHHKDASSNRN